MDLVEKERPRGGERDPMKMLARRACGNTTVLYMASFYGGTPYARADGRNLCAEIGGRRRERHGIVRWGERGRQRGGRTFSQRVKEGHGEREKKKGREEKAGPG